MEQERRRLDRPTVGEVIAFLQQFPADKPFRIEDPDTSWTISRIHTYADAHAVWFTGEYGEIGGDDL